MKRNYRYAYNALKKIGAPVFDRYSNGEEVEHGSFKISAESYGRDDGYYPGHKDNAPDGLPWADYYCEFGVNSEHFGVHEEIVKVLDKYGLYPEWENAGVLCVCD